jgi:hypothetical protein
MQQVLYRCEACIEFCGWVYQRIGFYQPVVLRLALMPCTAVGFYFRERWRVEPGEVLATLAVRGAVFQIDRFASAAQMISDHKAVHEAMAGAVHHAFRRW